MKKFLVNIWAHDHYAKFKVLSKDEKVSKPSKKEESKKEISK